MEALVVVALCAFVSYLVLVPVKAFFSSLARFELYELKAVCHFLQQRARTENRTFILSFNEQRQAYSWESEEHRLPETVRFGVTEGIKGPPSHPTERVSKAVTFQGNQIVFCPDGIIQPGSVYLIETRTNAVYALTCGITQVSFLRIYRYDGAWKLLL